MKAGLPYTYPEIRRIAAMWGSGMPSVQISRETGRSIAGLNNMRSLYRDLFPRRVGSPSVAGADHALIRQQRAQGLTLRRIAELHGISAQAVHYVCRRAA